MLQDGTSNFLVTECSCFAGHPLSPVIWSCDIEGHIWLPGTLRCMRWPFCGIQAHCVFLADGARFYWKTIALSFFFCENCSTQCLQYHSCGMLFGHSHLALYLHGMCFSQLGRMLHKNISGDFPLNKSTKCAGYIKDIHGARGENPGWNEADEANHHVRWCCGVATSLQAPFFCVHVRKATPHQKKSLERTIESIQEWDFSDVYGHNHASRMIMHVHCTGLQARLDWTCIRKAWFEAPGLLCEYRNTPSSTCVWLIFFFPLVSRCLFFLCETQRHQGRNRP